MPARLAMADINPDSQEAKLKSVRRRLNFGSAEDDDSLPTKDDLERKFAEERARHMEEKKAEWNFDFKNERPLEGRWEWERVDKGTSCSANGGGGSGAPANAVASAESARGDAEGQAPRQISDAPTPLPASERAV